MIKESQKLIIEATAVGVTIGIDDLDIHMYMIRGDLALVRLGSISAITASIFEASPILHFVHLVHP